MLAEWINVTDQHDRLQPSVLRKAVNMMRLDEPTSLDPSALAKMQEENDRIVKIVQLLVW